MNDPAAEANGRPEDTAPLLPGGVGWVGLARTERRRLLRRALLRPTLVALVTAQIMLKLALLGFGVRLLMQAVRAGQARGAGRV